MKTPTPVGQALAKALASQQAAAITKTPAVTLRAAETKAKAVRQASKPGAEPWRFAVNYRLDKTVRSHKGDYTTRYNALIALVHGLDWAPWHYATSSWEILSHQGSSAILTALSAPLDVKIDVLTVTPIGVSKVFGDPDKLEG